MKLRDLQDQLRSGHDSDLSYQKIAVKYKIHSKETVSEWHKYAQSGEMSEEAQKSRDHSKGWNRLLTLGEELDAGGWVVLNDIILRKDTSIQTFSGYLSARYGIRVTPSLLHDLKERQHISLQKAVHASSGEFDKNSFEQAVKVLEWIHALDLPPNRIYALDKTRFADRSSSTYQLSVIGRYYISQYRYLFQLLPKHYFHF